MPFGRVLTSLRYFCVSRLTSHPIPSRRPSSPDLSLPYTRVSLVSTAMHHRAATASQGSEYPRFSDRLNHRSSRRRYAVVAGRENGECSGIRRNPSESIRQCPPVTRQSGLILREKRVGSPRARSVTSPILIRTVHWISVVFVVVIVAVRTHRFPVPLIPPLRIGFTRRSRASWKDSIVILEETVANGSPG